MNITGKTATCEVCVDGVPLDPKRSLSVYSHSPTGFAWGYNGSGPTQLALAIMLLFLEPSQALTVYMEFRSAFISRLPMNSDFDISGDDVLEWLENRRNRRMSEYGDYSELVEGVSE